MPATQVQVEALTEILVDYTEAIITECLGREAAYTENMAVIAADAIVRIVKAMEKKKRKA
jgi:hypothetical protein